MTQTIEYVVKVNATQAQQAVADIEKRFGGVDSVIARVDKSVVALERDMKDLNAAIARGGPNVAQYKAQLEQLRTSLYGAPGAAGRGGGAGGMGVGMAALEASRAIEDLQYGIGGVVNNIPGLVMALGGGAGLTAAISLGAVAANQLAKNFLGIGPAAKEAAKQAKSEIADLTRDLEDMALELRSLASGESIRRLRAEAVATAAADEARMAGEAFREKFGDVTPQFIENQRRMYDVSKTARDIVDAYDAAYKVGEKAAKAQAAYARTVQLEQLRLLKDQEELESRRGSGRRVSADGFTVESGDDGAATAREEREQRRREAANERMLNQQLRADEKAAMAAAKAEAERTRILEREARERERIREQEAAHAARLREQEVRYLQALGADAAAAIGTFAAEAAMGQEDALQNLLGAASQQAGGMIMLEGGKVMAAGIAGMLTAPNPASAAQIAGGAGLVAAGAAVQQIGPAAVAMLSGKAGAMGGTGATSATRDPGAAPRTSSGGGSGGPMIINVSYGAGGPLPEDVAREIERVMSSGNRRRGAA